MVVHVSYALNIEDLPRECIEDCGVGGGSKDEAVAYWRERIGFTVDQGRARSCLKGYGSWDDLTEEQCAESGEDLAEDDTIADRIMWLACGSFAEYRAWREENPDADEGNCPSGSSVFVLE